MPLKVHPTFRGMRRDSHESEAVSRASRFNSRVVAVISAPSGVFQLNQGQFVLCWLTILGIHGAACVYHVAVAYLHWYIITINLKRTMILLDPAVPDLLPYVQWVHTLFAGLHALAVISMLSNTVHSRQLEFAMSWRSSSPVVMKDASGLLPARPRPSSRLGRIRTALRACSNLDNDQFDWSLTMTESIELMSLTFQAVRLSAHVPDVGINALYVAVIVLKSWCPFTLQQLIYDHQSKRRALNLVLDALFDLVALAIIPTVIVWPYVRDFDTSILDFPTVKYYHDTWYVNAVSVNKQLFATSWLDFVSKCVPCVALFVSITLIRWSFKRAAKPGTFRLGTENPLLLVDATRTRSSSNQQPLLVATEGPVMKHRQPIHFGFAGLVMWGVTVLSVHAHAVSGARSTSLPACLLQMHPWLAIDSHCVVNEIICPAQGHQGDLTSMDLAFKQITANAVEVLIVSSCAKLEMPPRLQRFTQLQVLKIFNSTIQTWNTDAALTNETNSAIQFVYIVDTNMTELPEGLMSGSFPAQLADIEICGSNLTHLPMGLSQHWGIIQFFALELSPAITEFPPSLLDLRVPQLVVGIKQHHKHPRHATA